MIIGEKNLIIGNIDTIINDLSKSVFFWFFSEISYSFRLFIKSSKKISKIKIHSPPFTIFI